MTKFDLHMHSNRSDGGEPPETVVENAKAGGVTLMALTDHDTTDGVAAAMTAGAKLGVRVLPSVEMDTEWPSEVHILGIDLDPDSPALCEALGIARERRIARNNAILGQLKAAGYDLMPFLDRTPGCTTRLHIALALVAAGYAADNRDAFRQFLRRGRPGFCEMKRFPPEEVIRLILSAGGVPVWAHPFHAGGNIHALFERLRSAGLLGVEAYHPSASEGQSEVLVSLAGQNDLLVTCGSDSHGANRPGVAIGCTFRDTPELQRTCAFFAARPERATPRG